MILYYCELRVLCNPDPSLWFVGRVTLGKCRILRSKVRARMDHNIHNSLALVLGTGQYPARRQGILYEEPLREHMGTE